MDGLPEIVEEDEATLDRTRHCIPRKFYWNRVFLDKTSKKLGAIQSLPPKSSQNFSISCKLDGTYALWTCSSEFNCWIKTSSPAVLYKQIVLRRAHELKLYFQVQENADTFSLRHSGKGILKVLSPSGEIVAEVQKGQSTPVGFLDVEVAVKGRSGMWAVVLNDQSLVKLGAGKGIYPFFVKAPND
jgi:hypothetical protein